MQKNLRLTVSFLLLLPVLFSFAFGQCAPDSTLPNSTNYPKTWQNGCVGKYYEETVYFSFPRDTQVVVNITFVSFEVVNATLPPGLSYTCNVSSCKWTPTNTPVNPNHIFGCMTISGVPTAPFSGPATIEIEGCGDTFVGTQCDTDLQSFNVVITDTAQVAFSYVPNGLTVDFTDNTSTGPSPLSHNWQFGDGNASSQQNPSHTYASAGTYTVCYRRSDNCGDFTACKDVTVTEVGIEEDALLKTWTVAPNPATSRLILEGNLPGGIAPEIVLLTPQGQVARKYQSDGGTNKFRQELSLQGLANGLYICRIRVGERFTHRRIVIQNP